MSNQGTLIWNGAQIGRVSSVVFDMWYAEADWESYNNRESSDFEMIAMELNRDVVMRDILKGIVAFLIWNGKKEIVDSFLILSLHDGRIFMRLISDETAGFVDKKLLVPWGSVDDSSFFDKELKREISFFHPLRWRRVKAIAKRQDRDDVLYELKYGRHKYAVVHLTYRIEKSKDLPSAEFYKDWNELYSKLLLIDHKEWLSHE